MLKVDAAVSISSMRQAIQSLQENPLAMVVLISLIAMGIVGFALYVVLAALKQRWRK